MNQYATESNVKNVATIVNALVPGAAAATAAVPAQYASLLKDDNKEGYQQSNLIGNLISLAIFAGAVYLSWTCNSNCYPSMNTVVKSIRAFFAGIFGMLYLIIYFIAWKPVCDLCAPKM